jgi:hypothetical protein
VQSELVKETRRKFFPEGGKNRKERREKNGSSLITRSNTLAVSKMRVFTSYIHMPVYLILS